MALSTSRDMRLVQFQAPHLTGPHLGLESGNGGGVINLSAFDPTLPKTMLEFLEQERLLSRWQEEPWLPSCQSYHGQR